MSIHRWSAASRRRLWWRRFTTRQALERHPVSVGRWRTGLAVFLVLGVSLIYYRIITRDEAIRLRAVEFLSNATAGDVTVGGAAFTMFTGINLRDVRISVPFDSGLDPLSQSPVSREIFSASSLRLVHSPWRLLLGDLHVEQIIAVNPKFTLVHNVDTGLRNWQLLSGRMESGGKGRARPLIKVRSAKVVFVAVDMNGRRAVREEWLDADVRPYLQSETGYCIEVRRFSQPAERVAVVFDPGARLVTNTPFVDARTVRLQLPRAAKEFFDRIELEGEVKLGRMIYEPEVAVDRDTEIQLRRVRCRIPLAMLRSGSDGAAGGGAVSDSDAENVAVEMTRVEGEIDLRGDRLDLNISGYVNKARCQIKGIVTGSERAPDEMGIDLMIDAARIAAPEGPLRERIANGQMVPEMIRNIIRDYDPRGLFNLSLHLCRPPGPGQELTVSGSFSPVGASGASSAFPYRVDNLHGSVRFEPPKILVNLEGDHGPARITVVGDIEKTKEWARVDVKVVGTDVPFAPDLHELLPESFRRLWERFNPEGQSRVVVDITRPESEEMEEPAWKTRVRAELADARILFRDFPYPLAHVRGTLDVSEDRIEVAEMSGRHGDGTVRIDGYANLDAHGKLRASPGGGSAASFRLAGQNLHMDEALAAALPAEGRTVFEQFQPQGKFDLEGVVEVPSEEAELQYDLRARLGNLSIRYREFPYIVENASGEIRLRPEGISILDFVGRHGEALIATRGEVRRLIDGYAANLNFETRDLMLDETLRTALPPTLLRVWELLEPRGRLHTRTSLHQESRGGTVTRRHRTEVDATGASMRFRGFPLPLTDVSARAIVDDDRLEIVSLEGKTGDGSVDLSGTVEFDASGYHGTLVVNAADMTFNEPLLAALPPGLGDVVRSTSPTGRFGVRFDPVLFEIGSAGKGRWDISGNLRLDDASMNVGFDAADVSGLLRGHVVIDPPAGVAVDVNADLERAVLAGWEMSAVRGRIAKDAAGGRIRVEDAVATAYGGEATGSAEVELRKSHVEWQASLVARDLQLAGFLESMGGGKDSTATGSIDGNIILQGRSGRSRYREGAGEIFIRDAQVWRMPLVFAIFQVLNLTPDENIFHDGWIKYYLSRDTMTFQKIDLQGKAVAFIGGGRMDMNTKQIDITLVAGSPVRLKVPVITELLEGASRELMEVRLTGTMKEPNIQPQPLKSLTRALQTIFPEPPSSSDRRGPAGRGARGFRQSASGSEREMP